MFHVAVVVGDYTNRKSHIATIVRVSFGSLLLVYILCSDSLLTGKNIVAVFLFEMKS